LFFWVSVGTDQCDGAQCLAGSGAKCAILWSETRKVPGAPPGFRTIQVYPKDLPRGRW